MISSIEWLRVFIDHYPYLEYLVIFLGVGFAGELGILILSFLVVQNVISIYALIIFSFLGVASTDTLWFLLGQTAMVRKIITHHYTHNAVAIIDQAVHRISLGRHLMALIIAKFVLGTRILLTMHVGTKDVGFIKFIRYDTVAILVWLVVVVPIGLLSGFGFTYFAGILENLYATIGFVLFVIITLMTLQIWLKNRLTHLGG